MPANKGLTNLDVYSIAVSGNTLFVGTYGGGVFISNDNGKCWKKANNGLTNMRVWSCSIKEEFQDSSVQAFPKQFANH